MRTVAWLIEELKKFNDNDLCFAYEGEVVGIIIKRDGKQGVIYCSESEDIEETDLIPDDKS